MSTTYYSRYAEARISEARQTVERHTPSAWTGCCLHCGRPGPCPDRLEAEDVLDRYRRLPRRRPGASLHDPSPSDRHFDWFDEH